MRVHLSKRGQVWHAYFRKNGKRIRKSLQVENRKIAEDLRLKLEWQLNSGEEPLRVKRTRINNYLEEFREFSISRKRPKTQVIDMGRLNEFLDSIDTAYLQDIETADVSRFLSRKALRDGSAPATILRYREICHTFFNHAKRMKYIRDNPVSDVPRPAIPQRDPRFLSLDQVEKLLEVVERDRIAPLVATLVFAGLRREEVCWLTWNDLQLRFKPPVLKVRSKTVGDESWMPKTRRDRTIPISPKLMEHLRKVGKNGTPWVFTSLQGCRWDPDNLSKRYRRILKKAGLPWNFLDLRHTFGSQLAMKGVSLIKIAQLMGNSPEIARRHYIQLIPEELAVDVVF